MSCLLVRTVAARLPFVPERSAALLRERHRALWLAVGAGLLALAHAVVAAAPVITQHPQPQLNVPTNSTATFTVTANNSPTGGPIGYQWKKNGVILAGEVDQNLVLPNVQISDGGSYSVSVFDLEGAVNSKAALLTFDPQQVPFYNFTDQFDPASRPFLVGANICRRGSNTFANTFLEPGEPNHGNQFSGRSVWATWVAPSGGICQISTVGSSFDTILAVYSGQALSNVVP